MYGQWNLKSSSFLFFLFGYVANGITKSQTKYESYNRETRPHLMMLAKQFQVHLLVPPFLCPHAWAPCGEMMRISFPGRP